MQCVEDIQKLLATSEQMQKQLQEVLRILNFRDRQLHTAMDALEDIGAMGFSDKQFVRASEKAADAINKMREIHKESLTK